MIEQILEKEEEHAEDMATLLARLPASEKQAAQEQQPKSA
jgi:hypothetical protein